MRLDPELEIALGGVSPFDILADPMATRQRLRALLAGTPPPHDPRIVVRDAAFRGPAGPVDLRIYQPTEVGGGPRPGVLYFHGGAFISGDLDTGDSNCRDICVAGGAVVISVGYRLAPEHRYPAAFDDCYAALAWLAESAEELGVDTGRLAVSGRSAGGALAAAVALAARDRGGPPLIYQLLLVPVTDDRNDQPSVDEISDGRVVDGAVVRGMWPLYMGGQAADAYAAPARAADLAGLPAACLVVCEQDPLRDQGLAYGLRLVAAGVHTELHLIPGAFHLFEGFAPGSRLARRTTETWTQALAAGLRA